MKTPKMYHLKRPAHDWELAYLAGVMDGEGCIHIARLNDNRPRLVGREPTMSYRVYVQVSMVDRVGVSLFEEIFGGCVMFSRRTGRSAKYRPIWRWDISSGRAVYVIDTLLPWLRVKRPQALLALEFGRGVKQPGYRGYTTEQVAEKHALHLRMRGLKQIAVNE